MSESIDIYIDTTSHESSEITEFDFELFDRFVSGGPWVAHSEYMKLMAENAKLRGEVERLHAEQAHWELGNCPSCPNVVSLQEALEKNVKLRELADSSYTFAFNCYHGVFNQEAFFGLREKYHDAGIEVPS